MTERRIRNKALEHTVAQIDAPGVHNIDPAADQLSVGYLSPQGF